MMAKKAKNRTRLRADDFPIPKTIGDSDFEEICNTLHITSSSQADLKLRLDQLVNALAERMRQGRPDQKSDRKRIQDALSHIQKALFLIDKLGPSGCMALSANSDLLGPMLAAQWMSERFPDDDYAPQRSHLPKASAGMRAPMREPMRVQQYFIEEHSLRARLELVRKYPKRVIAAALKELQKGLAITLRDLELQRGSRGGPKPLTYRHYLIINLAEIWNWLGKAPSAGPKSSFVDFCAVIAVSIGWPSEGIESAAPNALKDWLNLTAYRKRLSK